MSTARHRAREIAFQILYRHDSPTKTQDNKETTLQEDLNYHFEHFEVPPQLREFATKLVVGTLEEREKIDQILAKHASNWKIARMATIDRCILRMATYEMLNFKDIPRSVTIDEAIELGKQFGTAESPAFINGILDNIEKEPNGN